MISFFARHRKVIFGATTAVFLIGIFMGLGSYLYSGAGSSDAVAKVGRETIPYKLYQSNVRRYMEKLQGDGVELPEAITDRVKKEVLREMIVQQVLSMSAREYGLRVSDFEIADEIKSNPAFYQDGAFRPDRYLNGVWQNLRMTPEEYEAQRKKAHLAAKFQGLMMDAVKLSPKEIEELYFLSNKSKTQKDFAKEKDEFAQKVASNAGTELLNIYLKQYSGRTEVKVMLDQREKGV